VLGILPGLLGVIQATETIKLILGIGEPLIGRLLLVDALGMNFRTLKLRKNPECPVCSANPTLTELIDYDQFCGIEKPTSVGPLEVARDKAVADLPCVDGIPQISVETLKQKLDAKEDVFVLDVREPHEYQIVNIGAPLIPLGEIERRAGELAEHKDREIVVHCKTGGRSQKAALALKQLGFKKVTNLKGGITAWADKIDPSLPKY
jgi:adenylyltransferase/sulfurtransferase